MPELARTAVGLRISGDGLNPDEVMRLLRVEPTGSARKGEMHRTASGREVVARSGSWQLRAAVPDDLNTQIGALLTKLPSAPSIWRGLSRL